LYTGPICDDGISHKKKAKEKSKKQKAKSKKQKAKSEKTKKGSKNKE
jgi:hypothetical protein